MAAFRSHLFEAAGTLDPDGEAAWPLPLEAFRQSCREHGWTLVQGLCAAASPGGVTPQPVYEALRDELLADLAAAMPVDMVALALHGAMISAGCDDCEGDILARVRALVGPDTPVGAVLDPHAHLTAAMTDNATMMVFFKEYPHTDVFESAKAMIELLGACVAGAARPTASVFDCRMLSFYFTDREPMSGLVEAMRAMERQDGVLSVSLVHGFPWGDTPDMGSKVLVYTDGDQHQAEALARALGEEIIGFRDQLAPPYPGADEALDQALAKKEFPVVLADSADNAGGGAPSDATFILERVLARGITDVATGPFWDPVAVQLCFEAGEGAQIKLRVGGKVAPVSGQPLDLDCEILALKRDAVMTGLAGTPALLGDVAVVRTQGVTIVMNTSRTQAMGTDLFTQFGVDLQAMKLIIVKSSQHFYASYSKVGRHVIYVETPGAITQDVNALPFTKRKLPKWPFKA